MDDRHIEAARDEAQHAAELLELGDAFFEVDRDWRIIRVNRNQERLSQKPRGETLGRVFWDVWPDIADAGGPYWREYRRCMEQRVPVQFEAYFEPLDLWTDVTAYPVGAGGMAVFFRDVSSTKRAERETRRRAAEVEAILGSVAEGVLVYDGAGRIVRSNAAADAILGYSAAERSMEVADRMSAAAVEWTREDGTPLATDDTPAVRAARHRETCAGKILRMRCSGEERWLSVTAAPLAVGGLHVGAVVSLADITARRRAEEELRASEARFRSVFEQAAIGMGRVRFSDARWIDVNDAFCRMLGRSRDEMLRTPWPEITHPDDVDLDLAPFRRMAAGELESYTVEKRFLHAGGQHVWTKLTLSLVRDASGTPEYEIAIIEDIGDRKRAEARLAAALERAEDERRRLAAVLEALPAGVVITDARGGFTHVNAEFKRIWGAPPTPRSVEEYAAWRGWWPETGAAVATEEWALSRALATGEVIVPGDVVEIEKFDGSGRATIINAAAPIRNARGEIVGGVLAEVDITVQKGAEAALRESQQLLRSTMDHFPTVIAFKDREGRFLDVNPQVERALALPKDRIVGRSMHEFIPSEAADVLASHDAEVMATRRAIQREEVTPLPTGTLHHLNVAFPLVDAGGRVYGTGHISHDITELKRAEAALREANEKLRHEDRRKDEFLGMLSHELRNPLAPIRNALYLLDHAQPEGQQARRAKDIVARQVSHLTRLVDDLLDVTRIARGKIQLRHEDLDLATLVRRTAEDYRPLMQDRGLELVVQLPPAPVVVNGDPARLTQVFGNLLNNAAKFTPAGGQVTLWMAEEEGRAAVHVRDTGPGIAPDVLPTIFEPFTQGKQTLARSEGGLGLGLSLVKGLVTLHGGEVTAASGGPERGTEFVVSLPIAVERRREAAPAGRNCASQAVTARRRVLVIDDHRDAADTLAQLIEMLGHAPVVAYDAPAGLAKASEDLPDLVLCDIGLPGMDGYEFARRFRALASSRRVRLVALSGYAQPEDVAKAAEAGFDAHVAKPPDPERLATLLG